MGNRRVISSSESEDEGAEDQTRLKKKKKNSNRKKIVEEESDSSSEEQEVEEEEEEEQEEEEEEDEEEPMQEDAKPIGECVRVSGKGRTKRNHYTAFEYDGNRFELEDPVLLTPEDAGQKPYVAIIKDITQDKDGSMMVTGQWFYRPEEAEKRGGGSWEARDTRELFYSFHRDEVPAESVMHKCIVHFVPLNKQFPLRSLHPGFIVQRVYDTVERKLWKLTDKDYEDSKQHEINLLVQKTRNRLGELLDLETEEAESGDQMKNRLPPKRKMSVDIPREDLTTAKSGSHVAETPMSCTGDASEHYAILANFNALTGDKTRDKWLEKLLQGVQYVCESEDDMQVDKDNNSNTSSNHPADGSREKSDVTICWPEDAVQSVTALEKASSDTLDHQKYNQKMRQLLFNLKNNTRLATRFVKRELEASVILNMSPSELKDGLTSEETATKEPEESARMQMTDARCKRCNEKKVGLKDIIQAGRGDRYQLECIGCGNEWSASRDEASALTIDAANVVSNVGTAPWATSKFEDVEKKLLSPRESEKNSSPNIFAKKTALESQKSFRKNKPEDRPTTDTTE